MTSTVPCNCNFAYHWGIPKAAVNGEENRLAGRSERKRRKREDFKETKKGFMKSVKEKRGTVKYL